jgi:hypothetical protein
MNNVIHTKHASGLVGSNGKQITLLHTGVSFMKINSFCRNDTITDIGSKQSEAVDFFLCPISNQLHTLELLEGEYIPRNNQFHNTSTDDILKGSGQAISV